MGAKDSSKTTLLLLECCSCCKNSLNRELKLLFNFDWSVSIGKGRDQHCYWVASMPLTSTSTRAVQFGSTKYIYMSHIIFLQKMITLLWGKKGREGRNLNKGEKKKENEGRKKEKNSVSSASLGGNFHS